MGSEMCIRDRALLKAEREEQEKRKHYKDPFKNCSITFSNKAEEIIKYAVNENHIALFDKGLNKFLLIDMRENTCREFKSDIDIEKAGVKFCDMMWMDGKVICAVKVTRSSFKFYIYDFENKRYYVSEEAVKLPSDLYDPSLSVFNRKEKLLAVTTLKWKEIPIYKLSWDLDNPQLRELEEIGE